MIVQVRGPMGAGKSTLVRRLLVEHGGQLAESKPFIRESNGKTINAQLWRCNGDLFVLGRYDLTSTSGAGGDFVNGPVGREIVRHYATLPHLLWESAFGSAELPKDDWLAEVKELGIVWAVLDTPADECIRRIYQRRSERDKNVGKSLDEKKIRETHRLIHGQRTKGASAGIPVITLADAHSYEQLHDLVRFGGWQCDEHPVRWDYSGNGSTSAA